jgi:Pycsar effector protein
VTRIRLPEESERVAKDLLDRARAETTQAENKAAILLAGVLASAGGIAAAVSGGKWAVVGQPWYVTVPFWGAAAATLATVACLASAIYPRSRAHPAQRLTPIAYFGDVVALDSPAQLRELLAGSGAQLTDIWIDQVWQTSLIVSRKYRLVRWSVRLLGVALALAVIVVIGAAARSY